MWYFIAIRLITVFYAITGCASRWKKREDSFFLLLYPMNYKCCGNVLPLRKIFYPGLKFRPISTSWEMKARKSLSSKPGYKTVKSCPHNLPSQHKKCKG